ncbi:MAG: ABC transporter substrate-binding protein [Chloroflexi bacterium]|nr:ABC transporter substrate-binding protein [Chloroflexota bacterium]
MRQKALLGLVMSMVIIGVILMGCAQKTETPAAKEVTVRLIMLGDATGPYANTAGPAMVGAQDLALWANQTNYIPGVKLDVRTYDHGADVTRCVASYKEAIAGTPKPVLTNEGIMSSVAPMLKELAIRSEVPIIGSVSLRTVIFPAGWYYSYMPSNEGQVGAFVDWIVDNWKADSKIPWIKSHYENRAPRIAFYGMDVPTSRANECAETLAYIKSKGLEYYGAEYIPMIPTDQTAALTRMKGKVDFVNLTMLPAHYASILKDANRLGIAGQFLACGPNWFDPMALAKIVGPELSNNTIVLGTFEGTFDNLPAQIQKMQLDRKYSKDVSSYGSGWMWADLCAEVIRKTAANVGADKVDGKACNESLASGKISDYRPLSSVSKYTWSNNSNLVKLCGPNDVYVAQLQDGKFVIIETSRYLPRLLPGEKDVPASAK